MKLFYINNIADCTAIIGIDNVSGENEALDIVPAQFYFFNNLVYSNFCIIQLKYKKY